MPDESALPPGPHRDLLLALHELYRHAGRPGGRRISEEARKSDALSDVVSHETVNAILKGRTLPRLAKLQAVVWSLASIRFKGPDADAEVKRFESLWESATAEDRPPRGALGGAPQRASQREEAPLDVSREDAYFSVYLRHVSEHGGFPSAREFARHLNEQYGVADQSGQPLAERILRPYLREAQQRYISLLDASISSSPEPSDRPDHAADTEPETGKTRSLTPGPPTGLSVRPRAVTPMVNKQISPGDVRTRAQLREIFGGGLQGGIIPSKTTNSILLFTDHDSAQHYGYQDGWLAEEDETGPVFEYTGEGSSGDQTLKRMNGSILRHVEQGRALHLFVAAGRVAGSGTKVHRYVGEFMIDGDDPFTVRRAPDARGETRWVYVFRLRPMVEIQQAAEDFVPLPGETVIRNIPPMPMTDPAYALRQPNEDTASKKVKPENNSGKKIARRPIGSVELKRREAELSGRFLNFLEAQNHDVARFDIRIKGLTSVLLTDLYDATDNVLYEIKGQNDRRAVRSAISQLIDYRRHIPPRDARLAVLLPERPHEDLRHLVESVGMALVYEDGDDFIGWPPSA
ncbi:hypothetical protein [Streptomyces sp. NPDC055287]